MVPYRERHSKGLKHGNHLDHTSSYPSHTLSKRPAIRDLVHSLPLFAVFQSVYEGCMYLIVAGFEVVFCAFHDLDSHVGVVLEIFGEPYGGEVSPSQFLNEHVSAV